VILDPTDDHAKFIVYGKEDEVVGVITTYISWEICFHINGIDFPHQLWKNLNSFFNRVDESHIMQFEKELISLDPHSFDIIDDYLTCVQELHLKLGKCGNNYQKKEKQLIELVLMNLRTPFDVFVSTFFTKWKAWKEYGNDTFEYFYGILIIDQHKLLEEGKLGGKHQTHLLKGKGKGHVKSQGMRMIENIPLHTDLDSSNRNLKGNQIHPVKV
jgi:hypothetical protein